MTIDDLRALADKFFEWPEGSSRQTVTTFSALLFAQHVLQIREKSLSAQNSAGMDELRNVAQRQLDAVAAYRREIGLLTGVPHNGEWMSIQSVAIAALRAALAQQDEPVQEPVAWMVYTQDGASAYVTDNPADIGEDQRALPLYTAPPQRKPLTDEQVAALINAEWATPDVPSARAFARAIERAHGIGEEA